MTAHTANLALSACVEPAWTAHAGTVDRFVDYCGSHLLLWPRGHSFMLTPNRRDWVGPGVRGMPEMDGATDIEHDNNPSFNIYPNLVTPVLDAWVTDGWS